MTTDKPILRQTVMAKLLHQSMDERMALEDKIMANLAKLVEDLGVKTIAFYHPVHHELDVTPLADHFVKQGVKVLLPRVAEKAAPLVFNLWYPGDDMEEDLCHIPCSQGEEVMPEAVLCPCIGYDEKGGRLGYGEGYFDRTFAKYPDLIRIGIAQDMQKVDSIPREDHDIPMHYWVTETDILKV